MCRYMFWLVLSAVHLKLVACQFKAPSAPAAPLHFTQKLDHFDEENMQTWQQAFYVNDSYWAGPDSNAPIFLMVGGEGPWWQIGAVTDNMILDWLPETRGLFVTLEHRYYGCWEPEGCPFNVSDPPDNFLQHLSTRQALADLAEFHKYVTAKYGLQQRSKWVTFGCSYPGMLSALARAQYPDLFYGAVALSAPARVVLDFSSYEDAVASSYASSETGIGGSRQCSMNIKHGHAEVAKLLGTESGQASLSALFNLTDAEREALKTEDGQRDFAGCGVAHFPMQYNDPFCTEAGCGIKQICEIMMDESHGFTPLERLASLRAIQPPSVRAAMCDMDPMIWLSNKISYPMNFWGYQTCRELGVYATCEEGSKCLFAQGLIAFDGVHRRPDEFCQTFYKIPEADTLRGIEETNRRNADAFAGATQILWAYGDIDPWHSLGQLQAPNKDQRVIWPVKGGSHITLFRGQSPNELESVKVARKAITQQIMTWLGKKAHQTDRQSRPATSDLLQAGMIVGSFAGAKVSWLVTCSLSLAIVYGVALRVMTRRRTICEPVMMLG